MCIDLLNACKSIEVNLVYPVYKFRKVYKESELFASPNGSLQVMKSKQKKVWMLHAFIASKEKKFN